MDNELENFILGKKIGSGIHRDVFINKQNPIYVIKVANCKEGRAVNLMEERLWDEIVETPVSKWFADVVFTSEAGKYLVQKKVEQLSKDKYPKEIPAFFQDTKYQNFGHLKEKGFVCVDFGCFNMFKGITKKMKKADWWGEEE